MRHAGSVGTGYGLGAQLVDDELHHLLVLVAVKRAGAVDEQATLAQGRPRIGENLSLAGSAFAHEGWRPLRHSLAVLAHHPLAAAGHVGSHDVEHPHQASHLRRRRLGDHHGRVAPARDIVGERHGATGHHLVGHHHRALWQGLQRRCGLATGGSAQVEVTHGPVDELRDDMGDKHRRGVLHIVAPAMMQRVEGERWSLVAVKSAGAPRHTGR